MGKLTLAQVSNLDDCVILHCIYMMMGHFIYLSYLKVHFMLITHMCNSKSQTLLQELPIPVHQQTDFTLKEVVILRLHDTIVKFCTRV